MLQCSHVDFVMSIAPYSFIADLRNERYQYYLSIIVTSMHLHKVIINMINISRLSVVVHYGQIRRIYHAVDEGVGLVIVVHCQQIRHLCKLK